jgi:hypothetical protein
MFKPFKPPSRVVAPKPIVIDSDIEIIEATPSPPAKKRRLIHIVDGDVPPAKPLFTSSAAVNAPRKPLLVKKELLEASKVENEAEIGTRYYKVLWYVPEGRLSL